MFETFETVASKGPLQVDAPSILAQIRMNFTLVNIFAIITIIYLSETFRTDAHEGTHKVLAHKPAVVGRSVAFIHVYIIF